MRAREIMSSPAATCRADHSLHEAVRAMVERDCGVLCVVDDDGSLVGVLTDRDACVTAMAKGRALHEIPVEEAMSREVVTCGPQDGLNAVEQLMSEQQIRRIPVTDADRRPLGVVSLNDLARRAAVSSRHGLTHGVTMTLAAISQPRHVERRVPIRS